MNYIVISPYFPHNFQQFSIELSRKGINVLGIGEEPYEQLGSDLQKSLTEYFRVKDLSDEDEVKRAVAFLYYKHGKIDRIESHNEHWLELDAKIRTEFNIPGVKFSELRKVKHKSEMKKLFNSAGVPTVHGELINDKNDLKKSIKNFDFPFILKPDNGVGALATYKIQNDLDLEDFEKNWDEKSPYFMEEFVDSNVLLTYDGLIDQDGNVAFETSLVYGIPPLDLINSNVENTYYIDINPDKKLLKYGRSIIKEFGFTERFFHIEFFKTSDDYIVLEYNSRPAGVNTLDAYNYAYSINLYEQYANIVKENKFLKSEFVPQYCLTISRRDSYNYKHTNEDIKNKYKENLKLMTRVDRVFANIMGDDYYCINLRHLDEMDEIKKYILEKQNT